MKNKKTLVKVNEQDKNTYVVCKECGNKFPQITHTHCKHAHNLTLNEYIEKHLILKKELYCKQLVELRKVTLTNMIKKYGEEVGIQKWERYKNKQAISNSFEYKQNKYGWTKEQYDQYNQNRASTRENFVRRHGSIDGSKKWEEYCKTQSYVGVTEEYFIQKYGKEEGRKKFVDSCNKKAVTLDNFIKKYGEVIGLEKWNRYLEKKSAYSLQSRLGNKLFEEVLNKLPVDRHENIFFDSKNHEYFFAKKGHKTIFVDFYDMSCKKIIEFAGDYWHGNPKKYEPTFYNPQAKKTARELYNLTIERMDFIKNIHSCKALLIWEGDYLRDQTATINKCIDFLNEP